MVKRKNKAYQSVISTCSFPFPFVGLNVQIYLILSTRNIDPLTGQRLKLSVEVWVVGTILNPVILLKSLSFQFKSVEI